MAYDIKSAKEALHYDPMTGFFSWINPKRKPFRRGFRAEHHCTNGYLYIKLNQLNLSASRLAWEWFHGPIPAKMEIDHKNRIKDDNRLENLRIVTRKENLANRTNFKPNEVGTLGVSIHKKTGLFRVRYKEQPTKYFRNRNEAIIYAKSTREHL